MANEQNLVSLADRTTSERREIGIKGGIASGEARRKKRDLAEIARAVLDLQVTDVADYDYGAVPLNSMTVADVLFAVHANKAMKGDTQAAKLVLDATKNDKQQTMLGGFKFVIEPGDSEL